MNYKNIQIKKSLINIDINNYDNKKNNIEESDLLSFYDKNKNFSNLLNYSQLNLFNNKKNTLK